MTTYAVANFTGMCLNGGAPDYATSSCVCPMGWAGPNCSTDVSDSTFLGIYQASLWITRVGFSFMLALTIWRTIAVIRAVSCSARFSPARTQLSIVLPLLTTAVICFAVCLDPFSREGLLDIRVSNALINAGDTAALLTSTLTVRVFVDIQCRFHLPSRRVKAGLDVATAILLTFGTVLSAATAAPSLPFDLLQQMFNVVGAVWLLGLTIAMSLYMVAILKHRLTEANASIDTAEEYLEQRRRLVTVTRLLQLGGLSEATIAVLLNVFPTTPVIIVCLLISFVIIVATMALIAYAMTRTAAARRANYVVPSNASTAAPQIVPLAPLARGASHQQVQQQQQQPSRVQHTLSQTLSSSANDRLSLVVNSGSGVRLIVVGAQSSTSTDGVTNLRQISSEP